jgi:hypothetical protein
MKTYRVTVTNDGTRRWYVGEFFHREDGPAVECLDGSKYWFFNGLSHRVDGPAVELSNGKKYWYLNGKQLTKKQFNIQINNLSREGEIVEVDGMKYSLKKT